MSDLLFLLLGAERARTNARSALPDAPVVPPRRTRPRLRGGLAAGLRSIARLESRVADRLDPACVLEPGVRCG